MVRFEINPKKFWSYPEWMRIRDQADEMTEHARDLVRLGIYRPGDLVGVAYVHPGDASTWYTGLAIDVRARRRKKSEIRSWGRALTFVRFLCGTKHRGRFLTFDQAMRRVEKRYPKTSRRAGFRDAAAITWNKWATEAAGPSSAAVTFDLAGTMTAERATA